MSLSDIHNFAIVSFMFFCLRCWRNCYAQQVSEEKKPAKMFCATNNNKTPNRLIDISCQREKRFDSCWARFHQKPERRMLVYEVEKKLRLRHTREKLFLLPSKSRFKKSNLKNVDPEMLNVNKKSTWWPKIWSDRRWLIRHRNGENQFN